MFIYFLHFYLITNLFIYINQIIIFVLIFFLFIIIYFFINFNTFVYLFSSNFDCLFIGLFAHLFIIAF